MFPSPTPADPAATRVTVADGPLGLEITLPARRHWVLILFLSFWMCGWLAGEVSAARALLQPKTPLFGKIFLTVWLTGWTFGGLTAGAILLWSLAGRERIAVNALELVLAAEVFGRGWRRRFETAKIRDLRFLGEEAAPTESVRGRRVPKKPGLLGFDHEGKTVRFCSAENTADALRVLETLRRRYPSLFASRKF